MVTYSLSLRDAAGKPVAVLGIDITTKWIGKLLSELRLHPSSFSLVLSEKGEVISVPADSICSMALAKKIAAMITDPDVKKEERADGMVTCFKFDDVENGCTRRVYFARKKSQQKWLMVNVLHDGEAFSELADMQRNILWASLIGLAVLIVIVRLFARNARKLQETLVQQQSTERELQIANNIQQALLPLDMSSMQDAVRVEIEGCLIPAREVGGDLYNVFVRDGRLFFCNGDVSGKGMPSALIMAVTQTLFRSIASEENSPARIMERLNAAGCRNNRTEMFVTLFIGVLNLDTGVLDYCNAGHERPLLDGEPLNALPNIAIGVIDDFCYEMQTATVPHGATLTLYTDGLTEALNEQNQLFGRKRVVQLLTGCANKTPKEVVDTIITEVKQYAGNMEQSDDLTLLVIRRS